MYNTQLKFHSPGQPGCRPDPSASVRLAAVLNRSVGQQNSGLFISSAFAHPVHILMWLRRCLMKYDPVSGPVMVRIHRVIVAMKVGATVGVTVATTGNDTQHYRMQYAYPVNDHASFVVWLSSD